MRKTLINIFFAVAVFAMLPAGAVASTGDFIEQGCSGGVTGGGNSTRIYSDGRIVNFHFSNHREIKKNQAGRDPDAAKRILNLAGKNGFLETRLDEFSNMTCSIHYHTSDREHRVHFALGKEQLPKAVQELSQEIAKVTLTLNITPLIHMNRETPSQMPVTPLDHRYPPEPPPPGSGEMGTPGISAFPTFSIEPEVIGMHPGVININPEVIGPRPGVIDIGSAGLESLQPPSFPGVIPEGESEIGAVVFDCYHANYASSYQLQGFYIARDGNVYDYNRNGYTWRPESIKSGSDYIPEADLLDKFLNTNWIGKVSESVLNENIKLIPGAANGSITRTQQGADMGASSCVAYSFDGASNSYKNILLGTTGDWDEVNSSYDAQKLLSWLRELGVSLRGTSNYPRK